MGAILPRADSVLSFELRHVSVAVLSSTIEKQITEPGFDAVVSSDDTSLRMGAGVSGAIRRTAGDSVLDETARLLPVALGDVVVTSAGRLPLRYIFHAVTLDLQRKVRPTSVTIRSIGRAIFRRCEDLGVTRLVLPAIATGAAGFSARESARIIVESLAEHAVQPTNLESVVFCIPHDADRQVLVSELHAILLKDAHTLEVNWEQGLETIDELDRLSFDLSLPGGSSRPINSPSEWLRKLLGLARRDEETLNEHYGSEGRRPLNRTAPTRDVPQQATQVVSDTNRESRPLLSGRYVLLEELGRGGMGIVYLAWDLVLRQTVAIKTLQPGSDISPHIVERLRREAAAQMQLTHHGIVRLFHFEPSDSVTGPYLIMEYVPWMTAEQWIAESGSEGLPAHAVLRLGEGLCDAVDCAHRAGILHLDIKPSNVFIDPSGEQPKLADFGIATSMGSNRAEALITRLAGTPAYMAPEQKLRGARVGPWTDVYLLAGTLWKLLTGEEATSARHQESARDGVLSVLRHGLAQAADDRPRDMKTFRTLLGAALSEII